MAGLRAYPTPPDLDQPGPFQGMESSKYAGFRPLRRDGRGQVLDRTTSPQEVPQAPAPSGLPCGCAQARARLASSGSPDGPRRAREGRRRDFSVERHRRIAVQPPVFRRPLAGTVLELSWRVREYSAIAARFSRHRASIVKYGGEQIITSSDPDGQSAMTVAAWPTIN
jgi:hypothetical protein